MKFANPLTEELIATYNDYEFKKTIYKRPDTISGFTDEDYPTYDNSATYNTGDYVIVDELKTIYRCSADNVSGKFPPAYLDVWVPYGFINSYKMLSADEEIGAKSVGEDVTLEFTFNRCDTLGIVNTYFVTLKLTQIDNDTDEVVIERTISGRDIGCTSFAEYFYDEIKDKTRIIVFDLEYLPNSTLKLEFSGKVEIGSIVIGLLRSLGVTLMGTSLKFEDKSKITIDTFTNMRKVIRYGHIRVLRGKLLIDTADFNIVAQKISEIIGRNVLFVPDEKDKFSEMSNIAYIEDVNLPVENSVTNKADITLIGVEE